MWSYTQTSNDFFCICLQICIVVIFPRSSISDFYVHKAPRWTCYRLSDSKMYLSWISDHITWIHHHTSEIIHIFDIIAGHYHNSDHAVSNVSQIYVITLSKALITNIRQSSSSSLLQLLSCQSLFWMAHEVKVIFKGGDSYSASHNNWCTATLWNRIMTAQCEGMGEVGSARYEPALLSPCLSIRALCYCNCQRSTQSHQQSKG